MKKQEKKDLTFETAFAQLEEIVSKLEAGDLALDESLALFEQGQKLAALCGVKLDEAELSVQQLTTGGVLKPFEPGEARS